ncbi:hypothetical protein PBAL39_13175 [Pedobacter sp. BAL39]|uniref:DUF6850 family outer membrane beta-barrel protein n=1 Tax=Pedobacter sp. BAL39 TaxID=391596 RepID=UPI0001559679|nr:DUF6850 family outer membrane beta-barrel protein [Pedobacter sp. BAL39]EDM35423.1 hypothetical protein PBAL39_13175 [Pedobacter sp. BAL39]
MKKIWTVGILLFAFTCAHAQVTQTDSLRLLPQQFELLPLRYNWLEGTNAAGMQRDSLYALGKTQLSFASEKGDLRRIQQPESRDQFRFQSERYQPLGKSVFYGSFSYTQRWDNEVHFSDVLDPYRGTPYLLADSVGGDWKLQLYALKLKAAAPKLWNDRLVFGIGANLEVSTGARQNDPRPLNTANKLSILPAVTLALNDHSTFGLNGYYGRYQEDISLEIRNTSVNHFLYKLLGLGQYELPGIFSVGSSRNYGGNTYGADLQYEWRMNGWSWLSTAGFRSLREAVSDGNSVPRKAGTWEQKDYHAQTMLGREGEAFFQKLRLQLERLEDTGIEFHEFYNTGTQMWQTILEAPFYTAETTSATLNYTILRKEGNDSYKWSAQGELKYISVDQRYSVPRSSQRVTQLHAAIKGGRNWMMSHGRSLQLNLKLNYEMALDQALSYVPITGDRTLIAREVLLPDYDYGAADRIGGSCDLQYNFCIPSVPRTSFYAKAVAQVLGNLSSAARYPSARGNRTMFNLSLGAYY